MANKFGKNIGITNIADQRSKDQEFLDRKTNSHRNTPYRTQPYDVPNKNLTKQFSQYPKSTSKILSDDTAEDDIPR